MKLHGLKSAEGSCHVRNHVGHGAGSGNGKASAHDQEGRKARSGSSVKPGFEDGQLSLFRRLPKRGFVDINRKGYTIVNLDQLNQFGGGTEVTPALLVETGAARNEKSGIKILGNGSLGKKLAVRTHKFSVSTVEVIDAKSGAHEVI